MSESLIEEIRKALKGKNKNQFIEQILKEKALYDALKKTGITIQAEDTRERAVLRPYGVLSKVQKIDQIDLIELIKKITEITTLKTLETLSEVTNIKNVESIDLIDQITQISELTTLQTLSEVTNIKNVESIDLIDQITEIQKISRIKDVPFMNIENYINNGGFETGDFTGWRKVGNCTIQQESEIGVKYYVRIPTPSTSNFIEQKFNKPIKTDNIEHFVCWARNSGATKKVRFLYLYTDHTYDWQELSVTGSFDSYSLSPASGKYLMMIRIENTGSNYAEVTNIMMV